MLNEKKDLQILEDNFKRNKVLWDIVNLVKEKPMSISEIARKIKINRSTLRYYLSLLKEENKIIYERKNNLAGRPTIISINQEHFNKEFKEMKNFLEFHSKQKLESPFTKEILRFLLKNKKADIIEITNYTKRLSSDDSYNNLETMSALNWLIMNKYIVPFYEVTSEGKKLFKSLK